MKIEELQEQIKLLQTENKRLLRNANSYDRERAHFLREYDQMYYLAHEMAEIDPTEGYDALTVLRKAQARIIRLQNALAHADGGIALELNISVFVDKNGHIKVAVKSPQDTTAKTPE